MRFAKLTLACLLPAGIITGILASPSAHAQDFDFEDQTATFNSPPRSSRPGTLTSLEMTKDGETLTITRNGGVAFDIVSNTSNQSGKPTSYGTKSLDPFYNISSGNDAYFIGNFSTAVDSISLDFGDYGGDADTVTLNAYSGADGTGTLLASVSASVPGNSTFNFTTNSLALTAGGIESFTLASTSSNNLPNSLFYDNITVEQAGVPEPGSLALFASFGLIGAGFLARRRKQARTTA